VELSVARTEAALILVKAVPRPSKTYQETVCCAGITEAGEWRRLYPVRFRQLAEEQQFVRWQWVNYTSRVPRGDHRKESRRIEENTLTTGKRLPEADRLAMLLPLVRSSTKEAAARGESLALIEPRDLRLRAKPKSAKLIEAERHAIQEAGRQHSFLDSSLTKFEPCPYAIQIAFTDQDGDRHSPQCGDWEATATFFHLRRRLMSDQEIITHLTDAYTGVRPRRRILFAMGTVARRPRQWLLLGVLRVQEPTPARYQQLSFDLHR
jgi:hypothetical protein